MAKKTFAENLKALFGFHKQLNNEFFDDITDSLIEGDIGARTAVEIVDELKKSYKSNESEDQIIDNLIALLAPMVKEISFDPPDTKVSVYLLLGVNGVGKTTSAAKMGVWYKTRMRQPVILAAADTFRAAAIEQLQLHGERTGVRVIAHQHGSDPGAVVFDAAQAASAQGGGLVIADTAGRLHNKDNLVRELQKIDRIASSKADTDCYKKILVLDATTGQNGLRQAEVFHEAIGVDGIILTKYDSSARGGIAISIGKTLGIPMAFVGTGEKYTDFDVFNTETYLTEFTGKKE
ncbi:signal recognition particle-docking protein FtsY [Brucepastera parasyntrophica]|uniref:signal recognition particle-docking protein FtsY n=1 Tax=Brucepastera parasyntrophica TaxID=2880008 RepID=UPI002109E2CB|nr:signal recognition particle-docking protein FtsY [Brucepastera parasyntrophica]ULQ59933.1 signal recognition particle-docking protein FtsY [Brucepastera parasyntrophica]